MLNRSTIRRKQAAKNVNTKWMYWMRKHNTEVVVPKIMLNPLPLPHPVCIAIEIYNRDSDDPIRLDDNICWDILRAVEECNTDIQVRIFISVFTCHCF